MEDVKNIGHEETHKKWGCFVYGQWGDENHKPCVDILVIGVGRDNGHTN